MNTPGMGQEHPAVERTPEGIARPLMVYIAAYQYGDLTREQYDHLIVLVLGGRAAEAEAKFKAIMEGQGQG